MTAEINEIDLEGPDGLILHLDYRDSDTPAMVWVDSKPQFASTFDCARATGVIDDTIVLTTEQWKWLEQQEDEVAEAFQEARAGMPEYE